MAKKKSTSKKKSTAAEKTLRAENKKLQAKLERAEKKADRWKAEARQAVAAAKKSEQKRKKLSKRSSDAPTPATSPTQVVQAEPLAPAPAGPDETWTVAALKDEARARGLAGYSRLSKADLLAALS